MFYVVTSTCIDVKDGACLEVCPVDCIYEGGRMMYIQPDECIDCGFCVPVCPVQAIYKQDAVPPNEQRFIAANAEFFGPSVTAWGEPGNTGGEVVSSLDARLVRDFPRQKTG